MGNQTHRKQSCPVVGAGSYLGVALSTYTDLPLGHSFLLLLMNEWSMCVPPGAWPGCQGGIYWIPTGASLASAPHSSCSLGWAFTLSQAKSWLCYPLTGWRLSSCFLMCALRAQKHRACHVPYALRQEETVLTAQSLATGTPAFTHMCCSLWRTITLTVQRCAAFVMPRAHEVRMCSLDLFHLACLGHLIGVVKS